MKRIAIIDYGMGNLHSVSKATSHAAAELTGEAACKVEIANTPKQIATADRVIFPGVGAIRDCMDELESSGLADAIREAVVSKPVLAICVGLQALMSHSEENGGVECLKILPGQVKRFSVEKQLKVPHMGWNLVKQAEIGHPLWQKIPDESRFYFVHSYFVEPEQSSIVAATTEYGAAFASVLARENLFAVQFHPEKSSKRGLQLLANFLKWKI